ncbi:MAG: DNA-directed RNA polymerase subunit omega [Proteobacteria bacterium]|nr:DNA-directed RNA polymerase subunit omega [Pseudomonadota bacterium]MCP4920307.1 DNA-directed RNA polymerase subunit omega [Pseudomonadota bacterium]
MARITIEDCLEQVPNRFSLVLVAAERTKQLIKGERSLLDDDLANKNKEVVTSLREIAAAKVKADLSEFDENMLLETEHGLGATVDAELPPEIDDDLPPEA